MLTCTEWPHHTASDWIKPVSWDCGAMIYITFACFSMGKIRLSLWSTRVALFFRKLWNERTYRRLFFVMRSLLINSYAKLVKIKTQRWNFIHVQHKLSMWLMTVTKTRMNCSMSNCQNMWNPFLLSCLKNRFNRNKIIFPHVAFRATSNGILSVNRTFIQHYGIRKPFWVSLKIYENLSWKIAFILTWRWF